MHAIQASCIKQINMLNKGVAIKDNKYCARGLEGYTSNGSRYKLLNHQSAYKLTLAEQDRQQKSEVPMAQIYHGASSASQLWAANIGLHDCRVAQACLDEKENEKIEAMFSLSKAAEDLKPKKSPVRSILGKHMRNLKKSINEPSGNQTAARAT